MIPERNSIKIETLLERAKQPLPEGLCVVPRSTPVVSFGNLYQARVVTIGINPSVDEFCSRHKPRKLFELQKKRLVDREMLGVPDDHELSVDQAQQVIDACFSYFDADSNPYLPWFNKMERYVLEPLGGSYFDGSAAHLDLVQWATDPVWQKIPDAVIRESLKQADQNLLSEMLANGGYEYLLLNGRTVLEQVASLNLFELVEVGSLDYAQGTSKLYEGHFNGTKILGWSLNVPSAYGVSGPQTLSSWLGQQNK